MSETNQSEEKWSPEKIYGNICRVVYYLEENKQINIGGIKELLEKTIPLNQEDLFEGHVPKIYNDVKEYWDNLDEAIQNKEHSKADNVVGALNTLYGILNKHSGKNNAKEEKWIRTFKHIKRKEDRPKT